MAKNRWHTEPKWEDTVTVNDGTMTYYAKFDTEVYTLDKIANDFARTYDHNGEPGKVYCVIQHITSKELLEFTCEP